jgi:hypothetical protein
VVLDDEVVVPTGAGVQVLSFTVALLRVMT